MTSLQASAQKQLRQFVEQLERIDEERREIIETFNEKLKEAKGVGFDTKALRKILRLRRQSKAEREEEEAILTVYCEAVGLLGTPLQEFADRQEGALVAL